MTANEQIMMETSMLFNLLPTVIQSRLPRVPSLRRSFTSYGLQTLQRSPSLTSLSRSFSGTSTPVEDYSDAMSIQTFDPDENTGILVHRRLSLEMSRVTAVEDPKPVENKSGINWRYANQGHDLLRVAANESATMDPQYENAGFSRQLYIHGITYLLRGLPSDLTVEEQLSIRSAIPATVVQPQVFEQQSKPEQRSVLHRTLASTIVQLFILAQCLLPYILYFLAAAYQYDREHKVVQRAMQHGCGFMDKVGKSSVAIGARMLEFGDGRVGQVVAQSAQWIVDGVSGGVQDGVAEIMTIVSSSKVSALQTSSKML